ADFVSPEDIDWMKKAGVVLEINSQLVPLATAEPELLTAFEAGSDCNSTEPGPATLSGG
ncbi:MAG: hypothetical protein GY765_07220, partial [bacterium]|nr:hypothetical protein [bacterium]